MKPSYDKIDSAVFSVKLSAEVTDYEINDQAEEDPLYASGKAFIYDQQLDREIFACILAYRAE